MSDVAPIITAFAALVTAFATPFVLWKVSRVQKEVKTVKTEVKTVHKEVKTSNGITLAALMDLDEGRRIRDSIPFDERTVAESEYVRKLDESEKENL